MRRRLGSIKFRIVAVVVVFTLASTLASAALSLGHFQRSARENLLRAAEFNLNLVAGLVSRDMESLASLRDWCGMDTGVSGYISGGVTGADGAVRAFETMNEQVRLSRAYPYLLRVVAVSQDYQRILQCGSGTTAAIPLNPTRRRFTAAGGLQPAADGERAVLCAGRRRHAQRRGPLRLLRPHPG